MLWALAGLFASAFLSATLLPGNSELALVAMLASWPQWWWVLLLVATLGNVLGSVLTVWLARKLPEPTGQQLALRLARRWGAASLIFGWAPVLGDALCVLAGYLRWPWRAVVCWVTLGKALRYLLLTALSLAWLG
ncbi:YqaA family protein [Chitinilyticum litopenaei]|uniref:YqaA family protein n=1 Tax=Chitinilyticum litopenaei TaxID=1121276 RepID=UPI0004911350|nr:DedA family protein [Chitinilyticum litopenaei]